MDLPSVSLSVLLRAGREKVAKKLMPFVVVQQINPVRLKAPREIFKPGSLRDIHQLLKFSGPQSLKVT